MLTLDRRKRLRESHLLKRTFMSKAQPEDRARIADCIRAQWMKLTRIITSSASCQMLPADARWPWPDGPLPKDNDLFWCRSAPDNGMLSVIIRAHIGPHTVAWAMWERAPACGLPIRYEWLSGLDPETIRAVVGDRLVIDYPEFLGACNVLLKNGESIFTVGDGEPLTVKLPFHREGLGN